MSKKYTYSGSKNKIERNFATKRIKPFFVEKAKEGGEEGFPLKSVDVRIEARNQLFAGEITHQFENTGENPINVEHYFPINPEAAVYDGELICEDGIIQLNFGAVAGRKRMHDFGETVGRVDVEEIAPGVLKYALSNLQPGRRAILNVHFCQYVKPLKDRYRLVVPFLLAPRYSSGEKRDYLPQQWIEQPYFADSERFYEANFEIQFDEQAKPVKVFSPTHKLYSMEFGGKTVIGTDEVESWTGSRDLILYFQYPQKPCESVSYAVGDKEYLLVDGEPRLARGEKKLKPAEYLMLVDSSESMAGAPIRCAKEFVRELLGKINIFDKFNIIFFNSSVNPLSGRSMFATKDNIDKALRAVKNEKARGGSEALDAVEFCVATPSSFGYERHLLIFSDFLIDFDNQIKSALLKNQSNKNVFCFPVSSCPNTAAALAIAGGSTDDLFYLPRIRAGIEIYDSFISAFKSLRQKIVEVVSKNQPQTDFVYDEDVQYPKKPVKYFGRRDKVDDVDMEIMLETGEYETSCRLSLKKDPDDYNGSLAEKAWAKLKILASLSNERLADSDFVDNLAKEIGLVSGKSLMYINPKVGAENLFAADVRQPVPLPEDLVDTLEIEDESAKGDQFLSRIAFYKPFEKDRFQKAKNLKQKRPKTPIETSAKESRRWDRVYFDEFDSYMELHVDKIVKGGRNAKKLMLGSVDKLKEILLQEINPGSHLNGVVVFTIKVQSGKFKYLYENAILQNKKILKCLKKYLGDFEGILTDILYLEVKFIFEFYPAENTKID